MTRGKINVLLSYAGAGWAGKTTQRRAAMANGHLKFVRQYNKKWGFAVGWQSDCFDKQPIDYVNALQALDGDSRQAGEHGLSWAHLAVLTLQFINSSGQTEALRDDHILDVENVLERFQNLDYFNQRTAFGQTPLHLMAATWNLDGPSPLKEMVRAFDIILAHPTTDLDARDFAGDTPLHYAAAFNQANETIIIKLLAAGADPLALNHQEKVLADHFLRDRSAARVASTNEAFCRLRDAHIAGTAVTLLDEVINPPPDE